MEVEWKCDFLTCPSSNKIGNVAGFSFLCIPGLSLPPVCNLSLANTYSHVKQTRLNKMTNKATFSVSISVPRYSYTEGALRGTVAGFILKFVWLHDFSHSLMLNYIFFIRLVTQIMSCDGAIK